MKGEEQEAAGEVIKMEQVKYDENKDKASAGFDAKISVKSIDKAKR